MTDTTVLEVQAQRLLGQEQAADHAAQVAEKVVELRAEEVRKAQAAAAEAQALQHAKELATARKHAHRAATTLEDALEVLTGRIVELLNLPHGNEVMHNARQVITWRVETLLSPLLPDVRCHPNQVQRLPLTETLAPKS